MMGLKCSPSLRNSLNEAFEVAREPSEMKYAYIAPDADGNCRVLDGDGFCALHRECGEDVQPAVCRLYPRSIKPGEITEFCCSGSCEAVIETLMQLSHPLTFVREEMQVHSARPDEDNMDDAKRARREECMRRMQNRALPLQDRITEIGAFLGVQEPIDEERILKSALLLLTELGEKSLSLREYAAQIPQSLGTAEEMLGRFREYESAADGTLPEREVWLEQSLANHMYYAQFPYAGEGVSPLAAWDGLLGTYALLRLISAFAKDETDFADRISAAFRYIEHTDFYRNAHIVLRGHK